MLSLAAVQTLLKKFFRNGQELFRDVVPAWILHPPSHRRLLLISAARFDALPPNLRVLGTLVLCVGCVGTLHASHY